MFPRSMIPGDLFKWSARCWHFLDKKGEGGSRGTRFSRFMRVSLIISYQWLYAWEGRCVLMYGECCDRMCLWCECLCLFNNYNFKVVIVDYIGNSAVRNSTLWLTTRRFQQLFSHFLTLSWLSKLNTDSKYLHAAEVYVKRNCSVLGQCPGAQYTFSSD